MAPTNAEIVAGALARTRKVMRAAYDQTRGPIPSLGPRQEASRRDRGPPPSVWTSPIILSLPAEDDARHAVEAAVREMADVNALPSLLPLKSAPVVAEWVAVKRDGTHPAGGDSPESRFCALNRDLQNDRTIIFVHGGGFL